MIKFQCLKNSDVVEVLKKIDKIDTDSISKKIPEIEKVDCISSYDLEEEEIILGEKTGFRVERKAYKLEFVTKNCIFFRKYPKTKVFEQFFSEGPNWYFSKTRHLPYTLFPKNSDINKKEDIFSCQVSKTLIRNFRAKNVIINIYNQGIILENGNFYIKKLMIFEIVHYPTNGESINSLFKNLELRDIFLEKNPFL